MSVSHDGIDNQGAKINRASENLLIAIGRVTRSHGVMGEAKLAVFFESAVIGLESATVTIAPENGKSETFDAVIESIRGSGQTLIIRLAGFKTPEEIKQFTPALLKVEKKDIPPLSEGSYFYEEIIGLPVFTPDGELIGNLNDFFSAGEKDVWSVVDADGKETMIPCTDETLVEVDLKKERIVMKPLEEF